GGSGDQDDAVRQINELPERAIEILLHPKLLQLELHRPLVEDTHDDAFAMDHRDDGNADVDFAPLDAQLDAAILRQALFGDIQPRHDLEAAEDRRLEADNLLRHRLRVQQTVDAVANPQAVRLRLDVNVAGSRINRFQ